MTTHDWTSCKCDSCGARRADFRVNHKAHTYPKRVWREFRETGDTALLKEGGEAVLFFDGSKSVSPLRRVLNGIRRTS